MKKLVLVAIIIFLVLAVTGAVYFGISFFQHKPTWHSGEELIKNGTIAPPGKILEVSFLYDAKAKEKLTIKNMSVKNGYAPTLEPENKDYVVRILDKEKKILQQVSFNIPSDQIIEQSSGGSTQQIQQLSFTLTFDWMSIADILEITDSSGVLVISQKLENIPTIDNKPNFQVLSEEKSIISLAGLTQAWQSLKNHLFTAPTVSAAGDGKLNIVFVGERFPNMLAFQQEIFRYTNQLEAIEPFKSRKTQLSYASASFNGTFCHLERGAAFPSCSFDGITQSVNSDSAPYDKIVLLIYNNGSFSDANFAGFSMPLQTCCMAVINWLPYFPNNAVAPVIFVHELGHLLGGLADEYQISSTPINGGNCYQGSKPNPSWNGLVAEGDYKQRCSRAEWWRPYDISIMDRTYQIKYFNAPSQQILNARLNSFTGSFTNTVNPTVSISSPQENEAVSGTVTITASASDDLGVARVNLLVDGELYHTIYLPPYTFSWNTGEYEDGSHELEVQAYDVPGNVGTAKVTVSLNGGDETSDYEACIQECEEDDACMADCADQFGDEVNVLVAGTTNHGERDIELNAGNYSVTELPLTGWQIDSISCQNEDTFVDSTTNSIDVEVLPNAITICTFKNKSQVTGKLKIEKKTTGYDQENDSAYNACIADCDEDDACMADCAAEHDGSVAFQFHVDGPTLWDPEVHAKDGYGAEDEPVIASTGQGGAYSGTYTIDEIVPDGWTFESVSCINSEGSTGEQVEDTASISNIFVKGGESQITTCTFNNTYNGEGKLKIVKESEGGVGAFDFFMGIPYAPISITTEDDDGDGVAEGESEEISLPASQDESQYNACIDACDEDDACMADCADDYNNTLYTVTEETTEGWGLKKVSCHIEGNIEEYDVCIADCDEDDACMADCADNYEKETGESVSHGLKNIVLEPGKTTTCTFKNIKSTGGGYIQGSSIKVRPPH